MPASLLLVCYVLKAALRDKLVLSFAATLIVATSLSLFLSSAAIVEQAQFALVFTGGGLRLLINLALVLFIVFHVRRSFETKDVDFLLSRPIGRFSYIFAHGLAFSLLALGFSVFSFAALTVLSAGEISQGSLLWMLSVCLEAVIIANVALFFAMVVSSAVGAALACFGFYALGRMMGQILGIIDSQDASWGYILEYPMQLVSMVMPRLDLFGQTSWLVYGVEQDGAGLMFVLGHALTFIVLITCASLFDLVRRQF